MVICLNNIKPAQRLAANQRNRLNRSERDYTVSRATVMRLCRLLPNCFWSHLNRELARRCTAQWNESDWGEPVRLHSVRCNFHQRLPLIVLQACRLCEMVDFHLYSGSCSSVPSSAVICRRREVCAYIIGLALKPGFASKGVQLIAELNAVL